MQRLLITGAGGNLGKLSRQRLGHIGEVLRLSDIVDVGPAGQGEEVVSCDLGHRTAVRALVAGCDGIVHLGGISVEDTFDRICNTNIIGLYNLYEAARAAGRPRIVFASSNHTIGYYRQDQHLDAGAPLRPDGLYGVSRKRSIRYSSRKVASTQSAARSVA